MSDTALHERCGLPFDEHVCPEDFEAAVEGATRAIKMQRQNPMPLPPLCDHPSRPDGKPLCATCWGVYEPEFSAWKIANDLDDFRALFDRLGIECGFSIGAGSSVPGAQPFAGTAVVVFVGGNEFVFDEAGRFIGWVDYSDGGQPDDDHVHRRLT